MLQKVKRICLLSPNLFSSIEVRHTYQCCGASLNHERKSVSRDLNMYHFGELISFALH